VTARSEAHAGDALYRDPALGKPFGIGSTVRCSAGLGTIEFVAYSSGMNQHVYTVAMDTRTKLRLVQRDIELIKEAP